jgi:hypothetical protein
MIFFPGANPTGAFNLTKHSLAGFDSFIRNFKCSPQDAITQALGDINIDAGDLSDEYDFMDEEEGAQQRRAQEKARQRAPQYKYKDLLQKVANRDSSEIVIDLEDLATVMRPGSLFFVSWVAHRVSQLIRGSPNSLRRTTMIR